MGKKESKDTKGKKETYLKAFNLAEIAKISGIDYFRLHHVMKGNRPEGFTTEEKDKIAKAIAEETNVALSNLGSSARVSKS